MSTHPPENISTLVKEMFSSADLNCHNNERGCLIHDSSVISNLTSSVPHYSHSSILSSFSTTTSPFFHIQQWGLVQLVSFSIGLFILWRIVNYLMNHGVSRFQQFFMVSTQLSGSMVHACGVSDQVYHSLLRWLGKHTTPGHSSKIATRTICSKPAQDGEDSDSDDENYRPSPEYEWVYRHTPTVGYGTNQSSYKGSWLQLTREIITPSTKVCQTSQELLTLTTYFWNKSLLQEILEAAKPKPKKKNSEKLVIYKAVGQMEELYWTQMGGSKRKRPLNTLVLDEQVVDRVVSDVHKFLDKESWYLERGIPYRRGYLLYGPPGCGKSSIVKSIAGELDYNICIFSLSQKLTDNSLTELFNSAPEKSIILLEDIDAAFKSRENEGASARETNLAFEGCSQSALTFMGLLNALDGVASADDGQLVFMTTNYPERLDPALLRPGRVDLKICVDYPTDAQIEGMFKKFYPQVVDAELVAEFVKVIKGLDLQGQRMSMAMLQGLMVIYMDDPKEAVTKAEEHFKEQFSNTRLARDKCSVLYS